MRYLVVDDEVLSMKQLERTLKKLEPTCEVLAFDNYVDALVHAREGFDAAFLDVEMPGMTGVELAKVLQQHNPNLNVVFVTAFEQYALDAFRLMASGYVTKPYSVDDIQKQLNSFRYQREEKVVQAAPALAEETSKLQVRCFGYFEVFMDGQPIHFPRQASKEVLAYLIHMRGSSVDREKVSAALWEDSTTSEKRKGYFRTLIKSLRETLASYGQEDAVVFQYNSYAVNQEKFDCDYFRYLAGDESPEVQFRGEYMAQYSWGEDTLELLQNFQK